jgi:hypothetical protein
MRGTLFSMSYGFRENQAKKSDCARIITRTFPPKSVAIMIFPLQFHLRNLLDEFQINLLLKSHTKYR